MASNSPSNASESEPTEEETSDYEAEYMEEFQHKLKVLVKGNDGALMSILGGLVSLAVVIGVGVVFQYEFYENVGFRDMEFTDGSGTKGICSFKISETSNVPAAWAILVRQRTGAYS
ncbi:hypothetical protein V6N13_029976 [Hibiscus sabdariffa]|uniref:Uncharacterized protein n=2 Tax=Hibiscus sabdariffa TaxID=183260 RepID=A0ABR2AE63_9ROSI